MCIQLTACAHRHTRAIYQTCGPTIRPLSNRPKFLGLGSCQTCDREVVGSTPGRVAIRWLLLGWVTDKAVKHLNRFHGFRL